MIISPNGLEDEIINLPNILSTVRPIAVKAGEAIMVIYGTCFTVELKNDKSPLTLADTAANEIIIEYLRKSFNGYAILSEESKDDLTRLENDFCFIIDPLDGTKEFVSRNDQFTVNIALAYKHKIVLGVIYAPALEQLYYAHEGGGAFFEDLKLGLKRPIHVSDRLNNLIAVGSKSHASSQEAELFKKHKEHITRTVSVGSSIKGCMVAAGEADVYYRFGLTSEWDIAAMQCIVEEAGGIFLQTDRTLMRYNRRDVLNRLGFCVANKPENIWLD